MDFSESKRILLEEVTKRKARLVNSLDRADRDWKKQKEDLQTYQICLSTADLLSSIECSFSRHLSAPENERMKKDVIRIITEVMTL